MLNALPGHRSVLAKQIKYALSLPGKVSDSQAAHVISPVSQMCESYNEDTGVHRTLSCIQMLHMF